MKRRTFDKLVSFVGLGLAIILFIFAGLLNFGAGFANDNVQSQLENQNIAFPVEAGLPANTKDQLLKWAGMQVTTGEMAKDYSDLYILEHMNASATAVMGKPADWQAELHSAVTSAQEAGRNTIQSGIQFTEVEKAVNQSLTDSGYREYFTHGLGHGVGLAIHEDPFFGRVEAAKIASNTVITIEPGAYLKDKGGVRVEDTIVVNSEGYVNLTNLPYELLEL